MAAVWYRARAELRRDRRTVATLAVICGLVGGAALTAAAGARRTDSAYGRFLVAQRAYDAMVINYPDDGTAVFDLGELARLPQVADSARAEYGYVSLGPGYPYLAGADGRIGTEINRAKLLAGRRADPSRADEAVVSLTVADDENLEVGDTFLLFDPTELEGLPSPDEVPPEEQAQLRADIAQGTSYLVALPGARLRVVGIQAAPGELPPTPFAMVHLTPAFDRLATDDENEALLVRLRGGAAGVPAFRRELARRAGGLRPQLVVQRQQADEVERAVHLQAVALWLLAGLTAAALLLALGQALARAAALRSGDHPALAALGLTRAQRWRVGAVVSACTAAPGAALAAAVAAAASPLTPFGTARAAEPAPGFALDPLVLGVGGAALAVALAAGGTVGAWRSSRRSPPRRLRAARLTQWLAGRGAGASAVAGARMAFEPGLGRTAVPVGATLAGVVLGVATLVGAVTFAASLDRLLGTPELYGRRWTMHLSNYIDDDELVTEGARLLADDARVTGLARGGIYTESLPLEVTGPRGATAVDGLFLEPLKGDALPPVVEGRAPAGPEEIALGTRSLGAVGAEVGGYVDVAQTGERAVRMRVVGRVVLPTLSSNARLGTGALLAVAAGARMFDDDLGGDLFVAVAAGVDERAVLADLNRSLDNEAYVVERGKPADLVNFGRVEQIPLALGGILAALAATTLVHTLVSGIHRRRRDLAVLKALGFTRRQTAGAVRWNALALATVALVVGVPLGVAAGRLSWQELVGQLGVVSRPVLPVPGIAAVVVGTVAVAVAAAAAPGARAARLRPAEILRAE